MAGGTRPRPPWWNLAALFVGLTIPLAYWMSARRADAEQRARSIAEVVPQQQRAGYATSDRCEPCHPAQYHSWHRSYHRTMTQYATPESVRGDFSDVHLSGGGYDVELYRRGDDFMVEMVDPLWQYEVDFGQRDADERPPRIRRRVSMVTGSHHMQAYWVASMAGNGQLSMPFTYLFDDKRWVPRNEVFLHEPGGRHQIQVWNVSCITCHSTAGRPGALVGGKAIRTEVGEIGIACEACHGPGEAHIAANHNPLRRYRTHLTGGHDPTIVNPARLPAARASEVCGQCHALTDLGDEIYLGDGKTFVAGDELEKSQPLLRALHPTPQLARQIEADPDYLKAYFWADGTGRVSSRDFTGMIESKCLESGTMWCGTCHSMHDSKPVNLLAEGKDTDAACTTCHAEIGGAVAAHTHHAEGSVGSRCFNCHMPYTIYGLLKGIRNHRIDSPVVTGKSGGSERPNACSLCHVDRSLGWVAQALERWYQQPAPAGLTDDTPAALDWMLSGDAILRAIAAWQFGWVGAQAAAPGDAAVPYLAAALDDPYSAVRYVAGHALAKLDPAAASYDYLAPEAERKRVATEAVARWRARSPDRDRALPDIDARIKRLVDKRDNSPVRAAE